MRRTAVLAGILLDAAAVILALLLATWLKFDSGLFPESAGPGWNVILPGCAVSVIYWIGLFAVSGGYTLHWDRSWTDELRMVFKPVTTGMLIVVALSFAASPGISPGRWAIAIYFLLILLLLFASRGTSRLVERRMTRRGLLWRTAAVVGTGAPALKLATDLAGSSALGYRIAGFVRTGGDHVEAVPPERVLGGAAELRLLIEGGRLDELLVSEASNFHQDILSLLLPAASAGVSVKVVPDLFDVIAGHVHNTQILGEQLMELVPDRMSFLQKLAKHSMDKSVSLLVMVCGLPVWLAVSLAIVIDSRGPVFYRQERVGRGGRTFRIFKFRSMVRDAERTTGPVWAERDDPRVTRIGGFLRRTRLDEIPQIINVLLGEMSIVGPRPERPSFVEELRRIYPFYDKRLTVKPGITGWAQVKLEYDTSLEDVAEKLKLDFYYMENMSIFLDLEILARTIVVVLTGRGAH